MIAKTTETLHIVNGPRKMPLISALAGVYDKLGFHYVEFIGGNGVYYPARITGIEHEDDSGYSFNIKGYICYNFKYLKKHRADLEASDFTHYFTGYYNAETRRGCVGVTVKLTDN